MSRRVVSFVYFHCIVFASLLAVFLSNNPKKANIFSEHVAKNVISLGAIFA
jgi:hypothetical protein